MINLDKRNVGEGQRPSRQDIVDTGSDFLAADEDSLFGVVSIGDDKVGILAGLDGADLVSSTQCLGRVIGSGTDGFFLGDAPAQNVAQAGPHVGSGAGDGLGANQLGDTAAQLLIPLSQRITFSFPPAIIYSADINHSSIVFDKPLFNKIGFFVDRPSSFNSSKFCIFLAPT